MKRTISTTVLAVMLTACGGGGSDLADTDPNGAEACEKLAQAFEDKNDTDKAIQGSMDAAEAAEEATTASIRDAVIDLAGTKAADPEAMVDACRAEGVDMPDVPS
jgi:ABC-type glycerol-3-phosphate transport system substrate-binding protein